MWSYKAIKVQHSKSDAKTIGVYENEVSTEGKKKSVNVNVVDKIVLAWEKHRLFISAKMF